MVMQNMELINDEEQFVVWSIGYNITSISPQGIKKHFFRKVIFSILKFTILLYLVLFEANIPDDIYFKLLVELFSIISNFC